MTPPIIIAAFGTTGKARAVYDLVDTHLKRLFSRHNVLWAFTSRIVRGHLNKGALDLHSPGEVLGKLAEQGCSWAVVQSFNMICGHEFHRLVGDVQHPACRVSVGHSLLCSPRDHHAVAMALSPVFARDASEAVVLVGHGTDHCAWSVYPTFEQMLRQYYGPRAFVGLVEGDWPTRDKVMSRVQAARFQRVRLVPFMLVAGLHFEEELASPEDSWRAAFVARGIDVALEEEGLGGHPRIIDIFADHIRSALDVIPANRLPNRAFEKEAGNEPVESGVGAPERAPEAAGPQPPAAGGALS